MGNSAGISSGKRQRSYQPNSVDDNVSLPSVAIINTPSPTPFPNAANSSTHTQNSRPPSRQMGTQGPGRPGQRMTMEVERRDPGMDQNIIVQEPRRTETIQRRSIDMGGHVVSPEGQEVLKRREINMSIEEPKQPDSIKFHSMKEIKQYIIENPTLMSGRLKASKEVHGIERYKQKPKQVKTKQSTYLDLIHPEIYQSHHQPQSYHPKVSVGVVYPPRDQQENYINPRQAPPLRPVKVDQDEYLNYVGSKIGSQRSRKAVRVPRGYATDGNGNLLPSKDGILKYQPGSKQPVTAVEWKPNQSKQQLGTMQSRKPLEATDERKSNRKSASYSELPDPQVESRISQKPGKKTKQKMVDVGIPAQNSKEKIKDKVVKRRGYNLHSPDDRWSINSKNSEIASSHSDKDSGNIKPLYFKKTLAFSTAYHGEEMVFDPVESDDVLY